MSRQLRVQLRRTFGIAMFAAVSFALGGCAGMGGYPAAPKSTETPDQLYKVGPLDTLNIVVRGNVDLSGPVSVRPDGRITTPLAEDVVAAGRTPAEISRDIERTLGKYVRDPVVTVLVTTFQGTFADQIRIVGEAAKPQAIPFRQRMTLLDVMIIAGGLTDFADGNNATLVRGSEGGKQYAVRLKDLLKRGNIDANVDLKPGDIVIVPQSWF